MPPVGFELTISAGERPQTYASDRAATGTGIQNDYKPYIPVKFQHVSTKVCKYQHNNLGTTLTLRLLMSHIYGAPILDVSRSHTTTQHSR